MMMMMMMMMMMRMRMMIRRGTATTTSLSYLIIIITDCYYHGITRDLEPVEQWLTVKAVLFAFLAASGAVDKASFQEGCRKRFGIFSLHFTRCVVPTCSSYKVQGALPSALKSSITVAIGVFQAMFFSNCKCIA